MCQEIKANRIIEIVGLGDKEIIKLVEDLFPADSQHAETFIKQLDARPQLYSLCYTPMLLVMTVHIFKYNQQSLPSSLKELYHFFIVMTLIREEKKNYLQNF